MNQTAWMDDKRVASIDKTKLDFLQKLVFELEALSQKEKLPFLMALANRAKTEHINFSKEEVSTVIEVIKDYSTPAEIQKMDKILKMFQSKKL